VTGVAELGERVAALLDSPPGGEPAATTAELAELHRTLVALLDERLGGADAETRALHRLAGLLVDAGVIARLQALERVTAAADRLAEAGQASEIVDRAPAEACRALDLDRAVLSRIDDGRLVAEAVYCRNGAGDAGAALAALRAAPVALGHPLLEAEMLRNRRALIVHAPDGPAAGRHAFAEEIRWGTHLAAPVVLEGRVIGSLHGDRLVSRAPLRTADRDALWRFALAFARVFERAVLRRRLRVQRQQLRQLASWADARTSELSDGAIDLAVERDAGGES
jgi:hypothetical protein